MLEFVQCLGKSPELSILVLFTKLLCVPFIQSWKDPRLFWSPTDYDGLESIHLANEKVWHPDLEVYNTPGILSVDRTFASNDVLVNNDGTIYYVPLCNLISVCVPNPTLYPFDSVTCSVKIGSWTHNARKIFFNPKDNETKVDKIMIMLKAFLSV